MKNQFFKFGLIKSGAEAIACSLFCNYYNAVETKKAAPGKQCIHWINLKKKSL